MKNLRNLPVKAALCFAAPSVDFKVVVLHTFPMAARDFLLPRLLRWDKNDQRFREFLFSKLCHFYV